MEEENTNRENGKYKTGHIAPFWLMDFLLCDILDATNNKQPTTE